MKEVKLYLDKGEGGKNRVLYVKDGDEMLRIGVFSGSHDYVDIWLRTEAEIEESNKKFEEQEKKWMEQQTKNNTKKKWWQLW